MPDALAQLQFTPKRFAPTVAAAIERCAQRAAAQHELKGLKAEADEAARKKAVLQQAADGGVEKLYELCLAIETIGERHNDDSLLQFMLYGAA